MEKMKWQKPELISDREFIAYNIFAKKIKKYCWVHVVLWFDSQIILMDDIAPPDVECDYCLGHLDESEVMLYFEAKEAEASMNELIKTSKVI